MPTRYTARMHELGAFLKWLARLETALQMSISELDYTDNEIRSWYDSGHTVDDCVTRIFDELRSSYSLNQRAPL